MPFTRGLLLLFKKQGERDGQKKISTRAGLRHTAQGFDEGIINLGVIAMDLVRVRVWGGKERGFGERLPWTSTGKLA